MPNLGNGEYNPDQEQWRKNIPPNYATDGLQARSSQYITQEDTSKNIMQ